MERLGVVGIVVEDLSAAEQVNAVLHDFSHVIVGRMGVPHRQRHVSVLALIVDGTNDQISAMTGQLGRLPNCSVKTALTREMEG